MSDPPFTKSVPLIHTQFIHMFNTCLTICLTLDRYVTVVHPFRAKLWCTPGVSVKMTLISAFIAAATTAPKIFEFDLASETVVYDAAAQIDRLLSMTKLTNSTSTISKTSLKTLVTSNHLSSVFNLSTISIFDSNATYLKAPNSINPTLSSSSPSTIIPSSSTTNTITDPHQSTHTTYRLILTELYLTESYRHVYHSIVDPLKSFLIPLLLVLVFNLKLIFAFRKRSLIRKTTKCLDEEADPPGTAAASGSPTPVGSAGGRESCASIGEGGGSCAGGGPPSPILEDPSATSSTARLSGVARNSSYEEPVWWRRRLSSSRLSSKSQLFGVGGVFKRESLNSDDSGIVGDRSVVDKMSLDHKSMNGSTKSSGSGMKGLNGSIYQICGAVDSTPTGGEDDGRSAPLPLTQPPSQHPVRRLWRAKSRFSANSVSSAGSRSSVASGVTFSSGTSTGLRPDTSGPSELSVSTLSTSVSLTGESERRKASKTSTLSFTHSLKRNFARPPLIHSMTNASSSSSSTFQRISTTSSSAVLAGAASSDPPIMRKAEKRLTIITLLVIFLIIAFQTPMTIYRFILNLNDGREEMSF